MVGDSPWRQFGADVKLWGKD